MKSRRDWTKTKETSRHQHPSMDDRSETIFNLKKIQESDQDKTERSQDQRPVKRIK